MEQTNQVSRFSISALLGIVTALAVVFGLLRAFDAPAMLHFYVGTLTLLIFVIRLRNGTASLATAITAGAFFLPCVVGGACVNAFIFDSDSKLTSLELAVSFIFGISSMIPGALIGLFVGHYVRFCMMVLKFWTGDHQAHGTTVPGK